MHSANCSNKRDIELEAGVSGSGNVFIEFKIERFYYFLEIIMCKI